MRQGLLIRTNGEYQSIPGALQELLYRLAHHGAASPQLRAEPRYRAVDPYAAARRAARHKLDAALLAAGFHTDPNNGERRLRAVK